MEYELRDVMNEAFTFLSRQKYPTKDVVNPLRSHLGKTFGLNGETAPYLAAFTAFYFINSKESLVPDKVVRDAKGNTKATSFKLRENFDLVQLVEGSLPILEERLVHLKD